MAVANAGVPAPRAIPARVEQAASSIRNEKTPMRFIDIHDARRRARRRLPRAVFDYVDGGAEAERGLARNRDAFARIRFRPRRLVDVSNPDPSTTLLGRPRPWPFVVAPTGLNGILWPEGDVVLARAAAAADIPFCISTAATTTIEEIARRADGELWFQLYVVTRELADNLARRAFDAGCRVLVLTTDVPVNGKRLRDVRSGFGIPFRPGPRLAADALLHPRWLAGQLVHGFPALANMKAAGTSSLETQAALMARRMDASFDFDALARLRDTWPGRLLVKGLMNMDDARRCVALGADGVVLSNHGARQLDDADSPAEVLLDETPDVDGALLLDSGIHDAADAVKALALGADAVLLGRPLLYALAAAGEEGVREVFDMFKTDLVRTLTLLGCPSVNALSRDLLAWR